MFSEMLKFLGTCRVCAPIVQGMAVVLVATLEQAAGVWAYP